MRKLILAALTFLFCVQAQAKLGEYLVKVEKGQIANLEQHLPSGSEIEDLKFNNWVKVTLPAREYSVFMISSLNSHPAVQHVQPNYPIKIFKNPGLFQPGIQELISEIGDIAPKAKMQDNPAIPAAPAASAPGNDPLFKDQWGMQDIGAEEAWKVNRGSSDIVVAVLDTGTDYRHEDLVENLWRNPGEHGVDANGNDMATNGIDDDNNGYIDDVIGWDFATDDNKPFDLAVEGLDLFKGGNPGHGTHCAGNVSAKGNNGLGISGVSQNAKIMTLRFLGAEGGGSIDGAVKAIKYAVDNGAHILSNSWGAEVDRNDAMKEVALIEAIQYAQDHGKLFVAAAGNGHQGVGYDNDTDQRPAYPASYDLDIILSVAAIDINDNLGSFSNWGANSVDIGAPGVKVFSTTVKNKYSDVVLDKFGFKVFWDGTSMATPHVAGAAALYLSQHPNTDWKTLKEKIINTAQPTNTLNGKVVSNGKLDVEALMR